MPTKSLRGPDGAAAGAAGVSVGSDADVDAAAVAAGSAGARSWGPAWPSASGARCNVRPHAFTHQQTGRMSVSPAARPPARCGGVVRYRVFDGKEAGPLLERNAGDRRAVVLLQVVRQRRHLKLGLGGAVQALAPRRDRRALVVRLGVHDARLGAVRALGAHVLCGGRPSIPA